MLFLKGIRGERRFCGEYTEMKIPRLGIPIGTCRAYPAWICHQLLETAGADEDILLEFSKAPERLPTIFNTLFLLFQIQKLPSHHVLLQACVEIQQKYTHFILAMVLNEYE